MIFYSENRYTLFGTALAASTLPSYGFAGRDQGRRGVKHRMALRSGLGLIVLLAALCGGAHLRRPALQFCNDSAADWLEIAISHPDGAGGWTAEGWWRIPRGQCKTVITGPLNSRFYYFLANGPGGTWFSGETPYCIQTKKFELNQTQFGRTGERNPADCTQAGLQYAKFRR